MAQANPALQDLIQAIIDAANANQAATVAAAAAAVPAAQAASPFALLPGDARADPLDYKKPEDMKVFNKAVSGADTKFDMKEGNLRTFLDVVNEQARVFNWKDVVDIPDGNGDKRNLLTHFGQLSYNDCLVYVTAHLGQQNKRAQDDGIMYQYLLNSLTPEARLTMIAAQSAYTINKVPSGILFLKTIVGRSSVDTYAKVMLLRKEISNLHYRMIEMKGNVREFNVYVAHKQAELQGRGHTADELVTHLFIAYLRVPNDNFLRYINGKKDQYEDDGLLTADQLMTIALARYDLICQQEAARDEGEERIVALLAERMNDGITEGDPVIQQAMVAKLASKSTSNQSESNGRLSGNNRRRFNNADKKNNSLANAWKKVKPADGEPATKTVNGRKYNWCKYHSAWTMHSQDECTLGKEASEGATPKKEDKKSEGTLALNKALMAIMSDDSCA